MKAIKINTYTREVKHITLHPGKTLDDMQATVGGLIERALVLPNGDDVYVNEEGLFEIDPEFFTIEGGHQPFAGNAIVTGHDGKGNAIDCKSTVEEIREKVVFL